jgi:hypothetical protein
MQFFSMLAAVITSLLGICALLICCSYCQLQRTYGDLAKSVHDETRAVGLPDDYEYDEDNIYMQEREREQRAAAGVTKR